MFMREFANIMFSFIYMHLCLLYLLQRKETIPGDVMYITIGEIMSSGQN